MLGMNLARLGASGRRSLTARAISAIRRNSGTLFMVPDNLAGAFIDSTGTQPVSAVGDVLGLLTDRSYGTSNLGPVVPSLATAWGSLGTGFALSSSVMTITDSAVGNFAFKGVGLTTGKTYRFDVVVNSISGGAVQIQLPNASFIITSAGTYSFMLRAGNIDGPYVVVTSGTVTAQITKLDYAEVLGNHASQPTTANKPTVSARYNLLTKTEQLDDDAWLKMNVSVQANASAAPDETNTAGKLVVDVSPGAAKPIWQEVSYGTWTVTAYAKPAGYSGFFISFGTGGTFFNLSNGTVRGYYTTAPTASSIIPAGNGWYKCSITITAGGNCYFGPNDNIANDLGASFSGDGVSGVYVWHPSIVDAGYAHLPYQRVNTATDYDSNPALFRRYIRFDGSNDSLTTTITTGNEGWVCAGVTFGGAATANETVFANGAGNGSQRGVWLVRDGLSAGNDFIFRMGIGNGTALTMPIVVSATSLRGRPLTVEGGWTASTVFAGVDGTIASQARTGDATPAPQSTLIGAYTPTIHSLNGPMTALVYTPVLPSESDRALIRRWIGSLQGQTL